MPNTHLQDLSWEHLARVRYQHFHNPDLPHRDGEHVAKLELWHAGSLLDGPYDAVHYVNLVSTGRQLVLLDRASEEGRPDTRRGMALRQHLADLHGNGWRCGFVRTKQRGTAYVWRVFAMFAAVTDGAVGKVWLGDAARIIDPHDRTIGTPGRSAKACRHQGDCEP